jgi:hypothetical protein
MIINNGKKEKKQAELKEISEVNKSLSSVVGIRLNNEQLHKLKQEAIKEKRSISNLIKSKLF